MDIVQGLTGSEDGSQSLCSYSDVVIPSLSRVLSEKKVLFISCLHKKSILFFLCTMVLWDVNKAMVEYKGPE